MMSHLKSDQGQLFYEFHLSDAVPGTLRTSRRMQLRRLGRYSPVANFAMTTNMATCIVPWIATTPTLKEFQSRGTLLRAFYYTTIIEDQEYSSIRPLIDWLDYNGYTVVTKPPKEFDDGEGRRKIKRNMSVELAVDAMELTEHIDQMVLFSGDGDFRSLVEAVQRRGVRVTVVSSISSRPPMIADELRRQADVFTDLVEFRSKLDRDPAERPTPRRTTPPSGV